MRCILPWLVLSLAAIAWSGNVGAVECQAVPAQKVRLREGIGHVMAKIRAGQKVTVAYLGGSITAANGWRPKTTAWLRKTFPGAVRGDRCGDRRYGQRSGRVPRGA